MNSFKIKDGIYWTGAIDWHPPKLGYGISKGTSYNSYIILDDKIALIDTVKHGFTHEIISRIEDVIDPSKIDYMIIGNYKMDHSGSLPFLMKKTKNAIIVTTESSKNAIERYHGQKFNFLIVKDGDILDLGKRKLQFISFKINDNDILMTYSSNDKLLFSEDLFSQHIASSFRFDKDIDGILDDALSYFVNYLMPLGKLPDFSKIEVIAPNHGAIWGNLSYKIIENYQKWIKSSSNDKLTVIYSSMWRGNEKMAYAIADGVSSIGIEVNVINYDDQELGKIASEVFISKAVVIGCPSFKGGIPPELSKIFSYFKSIGLNNKLAAVFTCYEGKSPAKSLTEYASLLSFNLIDSPLEVMYAPNKTDLEKCFKLGVKIGKEVKIQKVN